MYFRSFSKIHNFATLSAEGEAGRRVKFLATCYSCGGEPVWPVGGGGVDPLQRAFHLYGRLFLGKTGVNEKPFHARMLFTPKGRIIF